MQKLHIKSIRLLYVIGIIMKNLRGQDSEGMYWGSGMKGLSAEDSALLRSGLLERMVIQI